MAVAVVVPEDLVVTARADCTEAACVRVVTVMRATGMIATSAMRVHMAPPFVGRAKAPSSARCWRAPAIAFGPRTASGKASSVLASRRRVCGRFSYAQDCVVKTPLISSLVSCELHSIDGACGHDRAPNQARCSVPAVGHCQSVVSDSQQGCFVILQPSQHVGASASIPEAVQRSVHQAGIWLW